jgi:hypothetical protein
MFNHFILSFFHKKRYSEPESSPSIGPAFDGPVFDGPASGPASDRLFFPGAFRLVDAFHSFGVEKERWNGKKKFMTLYSF